MSATSCTISVICLHIKERDTHTKWEGGHQTRGAHLPECISQRSARDTVQTEAAEVDEHQRQTQQGNDLAPFIL